MLKLVKKRGEYGGLTEIDQKAMRREAQALIDYINSAPLEEEEKYGYKGRVIPVVKAALDGQLEIPYKGDVYNARFELEGWAPMLTEEFKKYYFPFLFRIQGKTSLSSHSVKLYGKYVPGACEEIHNGEYYEWCDFEDPPEEPPKQDPVSSFLNIINSVLGNKTTSPKEGDKN